MKKSVSCEFNMDSACVELVYSDNSMISIDCTAVENEVADNLYQRSEVYLKAVTEYGETRPCI